MARSFLRGVNLAGVEFGEKVDKPQLAVLLRRLAVDSPARG
jgi:hypothetical protein